jgi:hypothetical protein
MGKQIIVNIVGKIVIIGCQVFMAQAAQAK